jgi:hypothetical protein
MVMLMLVLPQHVVKPALGLRAQPKSVDAAP